MPGISYLSPILSDARPPRIVFLSLFSFSSIQVAVNLFTYKYSGLNYAQLAWNNSIWETPNELKPTWDWSEDLHSPCWAYDGHNSFCKYGWARTLYVFSSFNLFACYFTTFAAFSWYAEGTIKDSQGGPPAM